jgi:hypothetical protein
MADHHTRARPAGGDLRPPEPPLDPFEFLSRSWSASAVDVPRPRPGAPPSPALVGPIAEDAACELDDGAATAGSSFSFASAATSQFIMERILAQSVSPPPALLSRPAGAKKISSAHIERNSRSVSTSPAKIKDSLAVLSMSSASAISLFLFSFV